MQVRNNKNFYERHSSKLCFLLMFLNFPVLAQQDESVYQQFAPIDLTGYWVSVVSEDWYLRMITPPVGNFDGLPLTTRAQEAASTADLGQLERNGQACLAYGAARILREPGRLRISWEDGDTLRIDTDAGEQTRFLNFVNNSSNDDAPSLQGNSKAEWQYAGGFDPERALINPDQFESRTTVRQPLREPAGGKLFVETNNLIPSMLRKNGIPLSGNTEVKEYFNTLREPDGTEWLIVTNIVHDPLNLMADFITSSNFQREADSSKWDPTPCSLVR
ncbi:MAG: hypothetical protein P8J61_05565 [Gammaproteobacteria bacterium]|jgi:hypothetical protein|nr:hypothetical protein [Gammaproteobacteria bacterium]